MSQSNFQTRTLEAVVVRVERAAKDDAWSMDVRERKTAEMWIEGPLLLMVMTRQIPSPLPCWLLISERSTREKKTHYI